MRFLVLDRYIARELVSPFAFGCMLFTFFPVIDRIYDLTDLVITKGVPFYLVAQLLVFMLPSIRLTRYPWRSWSRCSSVRLLNVTTADRDQFHRSPQSINVESRSSPHNFQARRPCDNDRSWRWAMTRTLPENHRLTK